MARVRSEFTENTAAPRAIRQADSFEDGPDIVPSALVPRPRTRREQPAIDPSQGPPGLREPGRARGSAKRRRPDTVATRAVSPHVAQLSLLGLLAGSAFSAIALATWSASDPSLSVAGGGAVVNLGGPVGAYLADILYQTVGWAAWCVLLLGAWSVLRLAGRVVGSWWNLVVGGFGFWMVATGLELAGGHASGRAFPAGGVIGLLTGDFLASNVGQAGSAIVVGLGLLAAATILFGINWQPIAAGTVERVQTGTPRVARVIGAAVGAAGRGAVAMTVRAGEAVRGPVEGADEDELNEVDPAKTDTGVASPVSQSTATANESTHGTSRAISPAAVKAEWDIPAQRHSVWSATPAPALRVPLEESVEVPTQVSGRSLVHVEWATDSGAPPPSASTRAADPYEVPSPRTVMGGQRAVSPAAPVGVQASPLDSAADRVAPVSASNVEIDGFDEEELHHLGEMPVHAATPVPAANAFGFADLPDDPPALRPIIPNPPADLPRPSRSRGKGAAVLPGDLSSGGVNDDGGAVRESDSPFQLPPLSLLDEHPAIVGAADEARLQELASKLTAKLRDFQVEGRITAIRPGPVITSFEYEPAPGIKISKIAGLEKDVAMALMANSIRIVAPVPGRGVVGFEIPNDVRQTVWARDVFGSAAFRDTSHTLPIVLGKDTEGRPFVTDLAKAPHLLVGGTTGAGKSVGVNVMLTSLLMTRTPAELRLILIDPKTTELAPYKDIPHLLHPVVTEVSLAAKVLDWTCEEMDRRYAMMMDWKVRKIESYNEKVDIEAKDWTAEKAREYFPDWPAGELIPQPRRLPYIVVVIDELADLIMQVGKDVETSIARIAGKARASGIHLVVATQSPRANVVTGLIKGNMPTRLSYRVGSGTESRIILDALGAQGLLGKGDQLFMSPNAPGLLRVHGPLLDDREVERVADFCRAQGKPQYAPAIRLEDLDDDMGEIEELPEDLARHYDSVLEFAVQAGKISTSMIQRQTKLGYNRACFIMEHLERNGVVGPADGAKPRKVLIRDVGELSG